MDLPPDGQADKSDSASSKAPQPESTTNWTYPTRMCRICYEDVVPTVTMYPPGLPPALQRPHVEYFSEDESYGRLIKPCMCRGGMRYIHEQCLMRLRTETPRPGSLWKCHQCGHEFNFRRLAFQRYLGNKVVSGCLAVVFMLIVMFFLGFVADPLINLYLDPYGTLLEHEDYWTDFEIIDEEELMSGWSIHFLKGMISMGLVGFVKTTFLNPYHWWSLRNSGWSFGRSRGTTVTGRRRVADFTWIAVFVGIFSAFLLFYQWTQSIISMTLQRIGNNIVDTQLPGDDDDIKPPPGFKYAPAEAETDPTALDDQADEDDWEDVGQTSGASTSQRSETRQRPRRNE